MKILVAYDGSEGANRALDQAAALVRPGDVVTVLAVAEGLPLFGHVGALASPEQEEERQGQLAEAARALSEHGLASSLITRSGDPATAILEVAEERGVNLIVMGTRGMTGIERWLIGSVSSKVLHHAH